MAPAGAKVAEVVPASGCAHGGDPVVWAVRHGAAPLLLGLCADRLRLTHVQEDRRTGLTVGSPDLPQFLVEERGELLTAVSPGHGREYVAALRQTFDSSGLRGPGYGCSPCGMSGRGAQPLIERDRTCLGLPHGFVVGRPYGATTGTKPSRQRTVDMVEALLGFLAFAVFGLLWLAHQDWFDLLPRRVTKAVSAMTAAVVVFTCLFVPSAFQAGFMRFVDYLTAAITSELQDVFDGIGTSVPSPTRPPAASPSPSAVR